MRIFRRNEACSQLDSQTNQCTDYANRPEICESFFCDTARRRLSKGKDPCGGCSPRKMAKENCCVGTDVGRGTQIICFESTDTVPEPQNANQLKILANELLNGDISSQDAERQLNRKRR